MRVAHTLDLLEEHFLNKVADSKIRADLHVAILRYVRIIDHVFDTRYAADEPYDPDILATTVTILLFDVLTGHDYKYAIQIFNKMPTATRYQGESPLMWDDFDIPNSATFMVYRSLIMEYCMDVLEDAVMEFDRNE